MARPEVAADETSVEEAINRVLEAERQARADVAGCEAQAAARVNAAREAARRVDERIDRRIVILRARCEQYVRDSVAEYRAQAEAVRARALHEDPRQELIAQAVARLAARLTGGDE